MTFPRVATYWMSLIALLLSACRQDAVESIVPEPQEPELSDLDIRFRAGVEQDFAGVASRGTMLGDFEAKAPNDDDEQQPWRKWPWVTGDEFTANTLYYFDSMTLLGQKFMSDVCVRAKVQGGADVYDEAKGVDWSYTPVKQWPNQGYLDFFAYYPSKETLGKMRINVSHQATGLTLPTDMPEDDLVETGSPSSAPAYAAARAGEDLLPPGISSLRFWHENPMDTVITFRCKMHPAAIDSPDPTPEGVHNSEPVTEYNDAKQQPDLMFAHHPHMAKPSVNNRVQMSFTHSMMAVRFWLKGADRQDDDVSDTRVGCRFRNISDFCINSVTFGPVYMAGECVAYDNTDWQTYYEHLNEATQYSDEHVKLRYVWKYGENTPHYTVKLADGTTSSPYTMAPPYGGCEYRIPLPPAVSPAAPTVIDPAYPLPAEPLIDVFTQRCDFSILDYPGSIPFSEMLAKTEAGWQPTVSAPILPVFDHTRGVSGKYSAFIIPPQMFVRGNPYIKVTYTITELSDNAATPDKMTFTTETVAIPMTVDYINIEDGEILDLYFTFEIDGDDYFKFLIDAKVTPWQYGGEQEEEWKNW